MFLTMPDTTQSLKSTLIKASCLLCRDHCRSPESQSAAFQAGNL